MYYHNSLEKHMRKSITILKKKTPHRIFQAALKYGIFNCQLISRHEYFKPVTKRFLIVLKYTWQPTDIWLMSHSASLQYLYLLNQTG